jgi:glucose/arabinose dehydrogenase
MLLTLLGVGQAPAVASPQVVSLPPGFTDSLVVSQLEPTDLAFLPDGKLVVITKGGGVRVYGTSDSGQTYTPLTPGWAIHLGSRICWQKERGLLGVAVDPNFAANRYLYFYYTYDLHGQGSACPYEDWDNPLNPVNRVSRFTLGADHTIALNSEHVLLDNMESVTGNHNAGALEVGRDGYLYVTVGDNACYYLSGVCSPDNPTAREGHHLWGKVLRITLDGGIPPGNPHTGADSDRCNVTGLTTPGRWCQEVFALGLRNPFRMAMDPNAAGTRFFINDVGQHAYEEIDEGQGGADYGWPCREGRHNLSTISACSPLPGGLVDPVYEYPHNTGCSSVTGGAFVPNGAWPADYDGEYLYADYMCGKIFRLAGGTATEFANGMGFSSAIALAFGPYLGGQALYYATFANGGEIRRIAYTAAPMAAFSAQPSAGALPLNVAFDASGSQDPHDLALTYDWAFGDGGVLNGQTTPTTNYTYTASGVFTATLVVHNTDGQASVPAMHVIHAGSQPPQAVINLTPPPEGYAVGQVVSAGGSGTDPEDGTLPPAALSWSVRLFHVDEVNPGNVHSHPHTALNGSSTLTFTVPPPEDLYATALSYLEVKLTVTDSEGLTGEATQIVNPRRVPVVFDTNPSGLGLTVQGTPVTTPYTATVWPNWQMTLSASFAQGLWDFDSWSDGGAATHTISAPSDPTTYLATYGVGSSTTLRLFMPVMRR